MLGGESHGKLFHLSASKHAGLSRGAVLGRQDNCDLFVEDSKLSKRHCTFYFDNVEQGWYLKDGSGMRSSLNGTWKFLDKQTRVEEKMEFRSGEILFEAQSIV